MNKQWWYEKDGNKVGPVTTETIHSLINLNDIHQQTLVWQEGMTDWMPIAHIELLNNKHQTTPPPLPNERQAIQPLPSEQSSSHSVTETHTTLGNQPVINDGTEEAHNSRTNYAGRW